MLKEFRTIKETADQWGVTTRCVQMLCSAGRIDGAEKFGRDWAIPTDAVRPKDKRVTSGKYRNWRRTNQRDT